MEWIDTSTLLKSVAREFAEEARTTGYEVSIEIEESLPAIRADQEALTRAIWNLLDNAVKYSPDCLTVGIKAYSFDNHVVIQVDDQGIGISQTEQGRIFEKFYRAGSAKAAKIKGTGLGLAMVKHIVTNHGGQLSLQSTIGAGSRFTIELPVERRME